MDIRHIAESDHDCPGIHEQLLVDPITQLAMSLQWREDYTEEYQHQTLLAALLSVSDSK